MVIDGYSIGEYGNTLLTVVLYTIILYMVSLLYIVYGSSSIYDDDSVLIKY
jgi:hypothetical protein